MHPKGVGMLGRKEPKRLRRAGVNGSQWQPPRLYAVGRKKDRNNVCSSFYGSCYDEFEVYNNQSNS